MTNAHGQLSNLSIYGKIGLRPTKIDDSSINFQYVDESPSMDNIQSLINIKKKKRAFNLNLGLEYKIPSNLYFKLGVDYFPGRISGFDVELGTGYLYEIKKIPLKIKPNLVFGYGSASIDLGDINNNDLFIQVNGTKFYSNVVNVDLSNRFLEMRPAVEIAYSITNNIDISAFVKYNITLSKKRVDLIFRGDLENGDSKSEVETIFANNVYLAVNGSITENSILGLNGLNLGLGVIFNFSD